MQKIVAVLLGCSLICAGAYRWGGAKWETAKIAAMEYVYLEVSQLMAPYVYVYGKDERVLVYEDLERVFLPLMSQFRTTKYQVVTKEDVPVISDEENENIVESNKETESTEGMDNDSAMGQLADSEVSEAEKESVTVSGTATIPQKQVAINRVKLQDFDYLRQNFYQIDNTTTIASDQLDVNKLLGIDMSIKKNAEGPQVLLYHTHSQEAYKDSVPGDASMSIVAVGDYLEQLLESQYGIEVLHHKGQYDVPSRDNAYSNALPNLEQILKENPTIEVVIDLHRDGVPESRHFVTEINGKPTAQIMFFNGLSRTTSQGELTYLPNPYVADNLAFSFQMQLAAAEYYPGLTRRIYLKGYRYNLHLCPKSILIEVGAQTNTFAEAKNAMEPLASMLAMVLTENSSE